MLSGMTTGIDESRTRTAAQEATALLRSLAHAERLLLLCRLSQGERCMRQLEQELGMGAAALSRQLDVLGNLELVVRRARDKQVYYSIRDERVLGVLLTVHRLFCAPAVSPLP